MKTWVRYTLQGLLGISFLSAMTALLILSGRESARKECSALQVHLLDDYRFVDETDIRSALDSRYGRYLGEKLDSIALSSIESILDLQSGVLESQAWTTEDGILHISIRQRKPVIRFMNGNEGFYVDESGFIFPLFERFTAVSPVIEGPLPSDPQWIAGAIDFVGILGERRAEAMEIHTDAKGNILFTEPDGDETIFFGKPSDIERKLAKLRIYRKKIAGTREYSNVNLNVSGQIVCK